MIDGMYRDKCSLKLNLSFVSSTILKVIKVKKENKKHVPISEPKLAANSLSTIMSLQQRK